MCNILGVADGCCASASLTASSVSLTSVSNMFIGVFGFRAISARTLGVLSFDSFLRILGEVETLPAMAKRTAEFGWTARYSMIGTGIWGEYAVCIIISGVGWSSCDQFGEEMSVLQSILHASPQRICESGGVGDCNGGFAGVLFDLLVGSCIVFSLAAVVSRMGQL